MAQKPLTAQEKANAKEIFDALDGNGDGSITHADMKKALTQAGFQITDAEITQLIKVADADNSGTVSWPEFLKVVEKRPIKTRIEAALRELFKAIDKDGDGNLSFDELKKLVKEAGFEKDISEAELKQIFKKVDTTGDGKISFEEFLKVFMD